MLAGDIREKSSELLLAIEDKKAPGRLIQLGRPTRWTQRVGTVKSTTDGLHNQVSDLRQTRLAGDQGLWCCEGTISSSEPAKSGDSVTLLIRAMGKSSVTPGHRGYPSPPEVLPSLGRVTPWGRRVMGHRQGWEAADELWRERVAEKHDVKQGLECVTVI